jgi:ribosomal protein L40E
MKRVCSANTLLGIHNHILNTHAVGAMGELPYSQTRPQIWIADPVMEERAREVVAELVAPMNFRDKICPHCGEANPGNFLSCWQCASALAC